MTQQITHAPIAPAPRAPWPADPEAAAEPRPAAPRRERDPYFDNAKYLAILLVVVGHCLAMLQDVPLAKAAYLFIYMFHMPLFIVITGYFSRNFTLSDGKARKLITNLGVPYVVFEFAYSTYDWLVGRHTLEISLLDPYYLTWFLLALFLWRLSTPVWQQIRWPLGVAVAISLLSYMSTLSQQLDMHRVLGLVPFYVLGLSLRPEHFELLKKPVARVAGALVLVVGFGFACLSFRHMNMSWIYWKNENSYFGVGNVSGTLMRAGMLLAATILLTAFLALVPARRTWFSKLGATTLYAYLLHGFLTRLMGFMEWDQAHWMHTTPGVFGVAAGALVVGTLLCTPPVVRSMRWALEPKMAWAFTPIRRPDRPGKDVAGEGKGIREVRAE